MLSYLPIWIVTGGKQSLRHILPENCNKRHSSKAAALAEGRAQRTNMTPAINDDAWGAHDTHSLKITTKAFCTIWQFHSCTCSASRAFQPSRLWVFRQCIPDRSQLRDVCEGVSMYGRKHAGWKGNMNMKSQHMPHKHTSISKVDVNYAHRLVHRKGVAWGLVKQSKWLCHPWCAG